MASRSIERPAGMPSSTATSASPCDSPAVRNLSMIPPILYEVSATFRPTRMRATHEGCCAKSRKSLSYLDLRECGEVGHRVGGTMPRVLHQTARDGPAAHRVT